MPRSTAQPAVRFLGTMLLFLQPLLLASAAQNRLDVRGDFLLYSYDFNYLYGRGHIQGRGPGFQIEADDVHVDVTTRQAQFGGACKLEIGNTRHKADVAELDLENGAWTLIRYGRQVERERLPSQKAQVPGATADIPKATAPAVFFSRCNLAQLQTSLLYYLNRRVIIHRDYGVHGHDTTVYVEGLQSVSFRSFQLASGDSQISQRGLMLDRLWFTPQQGIVSDAHLTHEGRLGRTAWRTYTATNLQYDILRRNRPDPPQRITIDNENRLDFPGKTTLSLRSGYITRNLFSASLTLKREWSAAFFTQTALEYKAPYQADSETWLRLDSGWRIGRFNQLTLRIGLEKQNQYSAELNGSGRIARNLNYSWHGAAAQLTVANQTDRQLRDANAEISYQSGLFTLSGRTSFHSDLLNKQRQVDPRLQMRITPLRFYGGLLHVTFFSVLQYSRLSRPGFINNQYKADISSTLESEPLSLTRHSQLSFSLQGEQFFDNTTIGDVTSLGGLLRLRQGLSNALQFELTYTYHTRRQSHGGLLAGTASQEWTAQLRLNERNNKRLNGWASLTCDTRTGSLTTTYIDLTSRLIGSWYLQTQFNHDYMFRRSSYNIYLSRRAGRIIVRVSYRSLSRQFIIEVLPG